MISTAITGVGVTRFGKFLETELPEIAAPAISEALADASVGPEDVDMVFVANAMAGLITGQISVVGQAVLRPYGFAEIPVFNIDNACAGSSSALELARNAIAAGRADTVLVVGVEKLYHVDRTLSYRALNGAVDTAFLNAAEFDPASGSVFVSHIYPDRVADYEGRYSLSADTLAAITVKNRQHAGLNPKAQYSQPVTADEVLKSRNVAGPITALMCAPISDGASAVVLMSASRAASIGDRAIWIRGMAVGMGKPRGSGPSTISRLAQRAYSEAGITPADVDLAEVHDSVSFNELIAYEDLGLCEPGDGSRLVAEQATSIGGAIPVNTGGGLESRGHPVAATGLAQIAELVTQIRGEAGARQVRDARVGVAENAGGFVVDDTAAAVVTIVAAEAGDR